MDLNSILGGTTKKNESSRQLNIEQNKIKNTTETWQCQSQTVQTNPAKNGGNSSSVSSQDYNQNIRNSVIAIICDKLNVNPNRITPSAHFTRDLGADSLDVVELIMEFEKAFNLNIPDDQAEKITTVGDAIAYIEVNLR